MWYFLSDLTIEAVLGVFGGWLFPFIFAYCVVECSLISRSNWGLIVTIVCVFVVVGVCRQCINSLGQYIAFFLLLLLSVIFSLLYIVVQRTWLSLSYVYII